MSKYICEKCSKPKPIDTDALQVGDEVKFTVKLIGRKSVEYKTRTGVITEIDGDFCSRIIMTTRSSATIGGIYQ